MSVQSVTSVFDLFAGIVTYPHSSRRFVYLIENTNVRNIPPARLDINFTLVSFTLEIYYVCMLWL